MQRHEKSDCVELCVCELASGIQQGKKITKMAWNNTNFKNNVLTEYIILN